jgi:hypothetical protein
MRGRLTPALVHFKNTARRFLALGQKPDVATEDFKEAGADALKAGFDYANVASLELDRMLEARVASSAAARTRSLSWVGIATVLATMLAGAAVWFFSRRAPPHPVSASWPRS